jgi:hypothetical protein
MDKNALWDDSDIRKKQCYVNRKKTAQCGRGLEIPQTNGYQLGNTMSCLPKLNKFCPATAEYSERKRAGLKESICIMPWVKRNQGGSCPCFS